VIAALPALPEPGLLRVLALAASLGLAAFGVALGISIAQRRPREQLTFLSLPLILAAITFALAGRAPILHEILSLLIVGIAMRNTLRYTGVVRVGQVVGAVAWFTAVVCASTLFGSPW